MRVEKTDMPRKINTNPEVELAVRPSKGQARFEHTAGMDAAIGNSATPAKPSPTLGKFAEQLPMTPRNRFLRSRRPTGVLGLESELASKDRFLCTRLVGVALLWTARRFLEGNIIAAEV